MTVTEPVPLGAQAQVFDAIAAALRAERQVQVQSGSRDLGVIQAAWTPPASRPLPLQITIAERDGAAAAVAELRSLPGMAVQTPAVQELLCRVLGAARSARRADLAPAATEPSVAASAEEAVRAAGLKPGDRVRGRLAPRDEIDRYPIAGLKAGEEYVFVLDNAGQEIPRVISPRDFQTIYLRVRQMPERREIEQVGIGLNLAGAPNPTESKATKILRLDPSQAYEVQIARLQPADPPRDYGIRFLRLDRAPERLPASIAVDQTIEGEGIDYPQDEDRFTFRATADQELEVYAHTPGMPGSVLVSIFPDETETAGPPLATHGSVGGQEPLDLRSSGAFVIPKTGTYTVVVEYRPSIPYTGPYRLRIRDRG